MTKQLTIVLTFINDNLPAVVGSASGITVLILQTLTDQLLNSLLSIFTALSIATLTFFLNRFLKRKFK